ncbi:hypothetical protein [Rhizobium mongolense]|nr:hypothetical protein [Rhizobium mongolense]
MSREDGDFYPAALRFTFQRTVFSNPGAIQTHVSGQHVITGGDAAM